MPWDTALVLVRGWCVCGSCIATALGLPLASVHARAMRTNTRWKLYTKMGHKELLL
jgi:hypothetical protein